MEDSAIPNLKGASTLQVSEVRKLLRDFSSIYEEPAR